MTKYIALIAVAAAVAAVMLGVNSAEAGLWNECWWDNPYCP